MEFMKELLAMQKPVNESSTQYEGKTFEEHLAAFYVEQPDEVGMLGNGEFQEGSFKEVTFRLEDEGQTVRGIEIGKYRESTLILVTGSADDDGNEIEDDNKYFVVDTYSWTEQ